MRKDIVIMSPTVNRALYEWKAFLSRWSTIIKKANRRSLCIELLSGQKIYFKGETEGERLRGRTQKRPPIVGRCIKNLF